MARSSWLALGGVALLGAASTAAILFLTRPPPGGTPEAAVAPPPPPEPPASIAPAPPPAPRAQTPANPGARLPPPAATPPGNQRAAPTVAATGPWDTIPVTTRRVPALTQAIEQARPQLSRCFDPNTRARYGQRGYSTIGSQPVESGAPVLMLNLEVGDDGELRIVDAPVVARGPSEDGLLSCAQEALRGVRVGSSGEAPGSRFRVRYPVTPTLDVRPAPAAPRVRRPMR